MTDEGMQIWDGGPYDNIDISFLYTSHPASSVAQSVPWGNTIGSSAEA